MTKEDNPDCARAVPEPDRVHYYTNEMATCADWIEADDWEIAQGMVLEIDLKEDTLAIVFYTLTGEFHSMA